MFSSFNHYAWPQDKWPDFAFMQGQTPERYLVPDGVLSAFQDGLRIGYPAIMRHIWEVKDRVMRPDVPDLGQGLQFGLQVLGNLKPDYAALATDGLLLSDQFNARLSDRAAGVCDKGRVDMLSDKSLAYPIYAAHELGHYVAMHRREEQPDYGAKSICEIQAFIAQHEAYDLLLQKDESTALQARTHRLSEMLVLYAGHVEGTMALDMLRGHARDAVVAHAQQRWGISTQDAHFAAGFLEHVNEKSPVYALQTRVLDMHLHGFAGLVSLGLHDRLKQFAPEKRAQALSVLYERPDMVVRDVLGVFDVRSEKDVTSLGRYAARFLVRDASRLMVQPAFLGLDLRR